MAITIKEHNPNDPCLYMRKRGGAYDGLFDRIIKDGLGKTGCLAVTCENTSVAISLVSLVWGHIRSDKSIIGNILKDYDTKITRRQNVVYLISKAEIR